MEAVAANRVADPDPESRVHPSAVAASLLHRVRNPLSVIITAASQLQEDADSAGKNDASMIRTILMAAEQIEDILRRYSLYACPEPPAYEPIDINELCRSEIDRVGRDRASERKRTKFDFRPADGIGPIACDHFLIRIALAELIDNAVDAGQKSGIITVGIVPGDDELEIIIEDAGHGIPEELAEKIWRPFYTTRPGKSGLGLPIAGRIISAHNGRILMEPCPGGGTRVKLVLPYMNHIEE